MIWEVLAYGFVLTVMLGGCGFVLFLACGLLRAGFGPPRNRRRRPPNLMHKAYQEADREQKKKRTRKA